MDKIISVCGLKVIFKRYCLTDNPKGVILFLHGWSGTSTSWNPNIQSLKKKFDCITVDLPGFGVSSDPSDIWGIAEYAKFVKDFISALGIEKLVLVGKSFGGRVATYYASKWPDSLSRLVLVSSAGIEKKTFATKLKIYTAKMVKVILSFGGRIRTEDVERKLFKVARITRDSDYKWEVKKLVTNTDLSNEASKISVKTLIIWGVDDKILPIKIAEDLNGLILDSKLIKIHGGHNAHIESATEFNRILTEFLTNKED